MTQHNKALTKLLQEVDQVHNLRKPLYSAIETKLGGKHRVVSLFTSFVHPVILEDKDVDMLEEVLVNTEMDGKELVLILNCPGGDGLAAERIVNLCRAYSPNGFSVVVPKMAKSAATMVCLGANNILMSHTSELGPIDPQILIRNERGEAVRFQAAHEIIESYDNLLHQANTTKGRLEPYLQQLARYDARDIQGIKSAQKLSESIAANLLKSGVLKKSTTQQITTKIKPLTDPKRTITHGRPLFHDALKKCGLNVTVYPNREPLWMAVWELYVRLSYLTDRHAAKIIESSDSSWVMGAG